MRLLSILALSLTSFFSINGNNKAVSVASIYTRVCQKESQSNICSKNALKEGFLSGTMIKTLQGYKFIEQLKKNDVIIGTNGKGEHCPQTVQNIAQTNVEYYIRMKIGNEILDVAPSQKFYLPIEKCWVEARNLTPSMKLLTNAPLHTNVDSIEHIHQNICVHEISVEGHTLYVTSFDILAHNCDAIAASAPLLIGIISATNPVVGGIGAGIALGASGTLLYNEYKRLADLHALKIETKSKSPQQEQLKQALPERLYYEARLQSLLKLRQEFLTIKRDIEKISQFFSGTASYKILQLEISELQTKFCIQPTREQEVALLPEQAQKLRELREFDLHSLEKEIENLQITLVFHVSELIEQRDNLINEHEALWNGIPKELSPKIYYNKLTPQQKIEYYQTILEIESCINTIVDKNQELNLIIQYYKNPLNAHIIKNSTKIIEILNKQQEIIPSNLKTLENERTELHPHINIYAEQALREAGINPLPIKEQTKESIRQQQNSKQEKVLEAAKKNRLQFYYPKPPKKDDEDKKKSHPNGIYDGARYHHKNSNGNKSPAPKNGQRALDNSVEIKNDSPHRISIDDGEFIVLYRTREPGYQGNTMTRDPEYHGHIRRWEELEGEMQKALIKANFVTRAGKIIT